MTSGRYFLVGIAPLLLSLGLLAACSSGNNAPSAPPQTWQGYEVRMESRPNPPRAGANEFVLMVSGNHGKPVHDVVVAFRTSDADDWKQAIQDGEIGVYRRAVEVEPAGRDVLQVQLKRGGVESVLRFPLQVAP
jgi:hypothetical protein